MAECDKHVNGGIRSYTTKRSSDINDMNGKNMNDNVSSCCSSVISGSMDFGEIGLDENLDEERRYYRDDSEGSCSREECVARIESTLRRNFHKLERRHHVKDAVSSRESGVYVYSHDHKLSCHSPLGLQR